MDIPSAIKINGIEWKIEYVTPQIDDDFYGTLDAHNGKILINKDRNEAFWKSAFWHEVVHAICLSREVKSKRDIKSEEDLCRVLGPALLDFIESNCDISWRDHDE